MNWITTVEPAPWSIAGFELGPLRFGHCLLLERFELDNLDTESSLHFFLGICSRTYKGARKWITSTSGQSTYKFKEFSAHRVEALEYLKENMGLPQTMESSSNGRTLGTPYLQVVRLTAITKLNYSPDTINESRFGQLIWDVLSYKEANCQTRVIDDYLAEQLERLNQLNGQV